ncbi:M20 family metallopeptidase [Nocardioides nitrophenolicus]|uniref:M20 family metallopeptidase n=1 Tax=Nocardioides nitrophenolicus TaxID=60489 RepID=UPI0019566168|nr:M20 family metallopeptidase [Nocardioides nitrophenolicus]MBM7517085.1 amidohydrolase [Nocardioides nitrophenolicus]
MSSSPLPTLPESDEQVLRTRLDQLGDLLLETSHQIHARPEIRFEEVFASGLLAQRLEDDGFALVRPLAGLPTAFFATYDTGRPGPRVAIFCEYDALPEIGHGCGHNVIASAGLGAALLVKSLLADDPTLGGTLVVVGSPAEEGGGGKVPIIASGALDGLDAAMMLHPSGENLSAMRTLSRSGLQITFTGRAAHAAVSPERGVNALDAAVLTLTAIGLLRQQVPSDVRIHAIVTEGGEAQNIIPERTVLQASVRAEDPRLLLDDIQPRVENCARGAALATGAEVKIELTAPTYLSIQPNPVLEQIVEDSYHRIGRTTEPHRAEVFPGSTDMGNVSQVVPSIHPNIEIVPGLGMHSREAAELVGGEHGDRAVLDGALMLAMTAATLFRRPDVLAEVREQFTEGVRVDPIV